MGEVISVSSIVEHGAFAILGFTVTRGKIVEIESSPTVRPAKLDLTIVG